MTLWIYNAPLSFITLVQKRKIKEKLAAGFVHLDKTIYAVRLLSAFMNLFIIRELQHICPKLKLLCRRLFTLRSRHQLYFGKRSWILHCSTAGVSEFDKILLTAKGTVRLSIRFMDIVHYIINSKLWTI